MPVPGEATSASPAAVSASTSTSTSSKSAHLRNCLYHQGGTFRTMRVSARFVLQIYAFCGSQVSAWFFSKNSAWFENQVHARFVSRSVQLHITHGSPHWILVSNSGPPPELGGAHCAKAVREARGARWERSDRSHAGTSAHGPRPLHSERIPFSPKEDVLFNLLSRI